MSTRKINTIKVTDVTPSDHLGRLGEITYRDGYLYYHDGVTAGGELINGGGGGGGGPTTWSSVTGKPSFATVATSGSYADLTGTPSIVETNQTLNTGDSVSFNRLTVTGASGIEGGEIQLAKAPNSTLAGDVIIDVYENKLRFFEGGGTGRGFYLDLTTGANNTSTNIMSGGSGGAQGAQGAAGADGAPGQGVPTGGTVGQVLAKIDSTDYNTEWVTQSGGGSASWPVTNTAGASGPTLIAIGQNAGNVTQGYSAVAVGANAGETSQGNSAVAIGEYTGTTNQGDYAVAVGRGAGNTAQGINAVAVGIGAGQTNQGASAVAIGDVAGYTNQGVNAVAIGKAAGATNQANNTIILNATGNALEQTVANTFTVAPIRNASGTSGVLQYNTATKEVSYSNEITVNSNTWTFGADGVLTLPLGGDILDSTGASVLGSGPTNEITNTNGDGATYSVSVGTDGVVTMNTARGGIEFGALPEVGGTTHLHIMRPAGAEGATDLFFGDDYNYVKMPAYTASGVGSQGVEIGSSYNSGTVSTWRFGTDGDLVLPAGKTIRDTSGVDLFADPSTGDPAYKGFKAHYGRMWGNTDDPNGPINKIVIYKDTATPSSTIDASSNQDTFTVTGLTGSDVVVMLVAIGEDVNQTPTAELKTFAEYIIDNVILDGGVEGDINTAAAMKTAFYNNFTIFSATLNDLKTGFEFFSVNNQFNISPAFATGKGATFNGISYNMSNDTLGEGSWGQDVGTHQVGDVFVIPGNTIQDANSNFLSTPANDVTITITSESGGSIGSFTVTGTLPRPAETWPSNSIGDGGDDEYDTGNYITTNLESNISYNGGNVVSGSSAFGGGDYVVTYKDSIFGVFAVTTAIDSIATQGSSGMDGDGQADTGSLYGAASSGVSIGDFSFSASTMTASDDDLYIKAVDDLWLDALDDDVHIRANDDVRIKAGFDFQADSAQSEWRFGNEGIIYFPNGSEQSTAYTGDYDDLTNKPTIPTSFSSLVNGSYTASLGTDGTLTLPAGGNISEGGGISGAIKLTPAGGANEYQALVIYPTAVGDGDHIHLTAGGGTTELYLGNDFHYVKLVEPSGNIEVRATHPDADTAAWTFDTAGNIDAQQALGIKVPDGVPSSVTDITMITASWELNPLSNLATTGGSGSGLTVNITETGGYASAIAIATAGTGYTAGDVITVTSGTSSATFTIAVAGRNTWGFGTDGDLYIPPGKTIRDAMSGDNLLGGGTTLPANASGYLVNDGTGALSWAAGDGTFSGAYADLTGKPTLFDGDYNSLTNKPTYRIAVVGATGGPVGANLQADSLALAGLNPVTDIPSTWGGDLILQGGVGGANGDLYGEVRIKSGQIGANYEWHFTTDKKIRLPAGGNIVDSTGASVLGGSGSYTPANASNWAGTAPTTIAEALDRIAAKLLTLGGDLP